MRQNSVNSASGLKTDLTSPLCSATMISYKGDKLWHLTTLKRVCTYFHRKCAETAI